MGRGIALAVPLFFKKVSKKQLTDTLGGYIIHSDTRRGYIMYCEVDRNGAEKLLLQ